MQLKQIDQKCKHVIWFDELGGDFSDFIKNSVAEKIDTKHINQYIINSKNTDNESLIELESLIFNIKKKNSNSKEDLIMIYLSKDNKFLDQIRQIFQKHNYSLGKIIVLIELLNSELSKFILDDSLGEISITKKNQDNAKSNAQINIDAINFAIDHDDGKNINKDFDRSEIIIIGPSRSGKTPVSFYLAYHNYLVSNVPIFSDCDMSFLDYISNKTVIGLIMEPETLFELRETRRIVENKDVAFQLNVSKNYTSMNNIINEIYQSKILYSNIGCHVIDTTSKSIEEIASKIIKIDLWRKESAKK